MKKVTLILTGSIASIKSGRLINLLNSKYDVRVIFTKSAQMFINQHEIINSVNEVYSDDFTVDELKSIAHINLAKETDLLLIAPCSYDYLNKIAGGIADSFSLSVIAAIAKEKIMIAPAMNTNMYENVILQKNIETLKSYGVNFISPDVGMLSCGDLGIGKLAKIKVIGKNVDSYFCSKNQMKLIITGGSTKVYIDPVRYITNNSSGNFSKEMVNHALKNNFEVHYIHGENVDVTDMSEYVHTYQVATNSELIEKINNIGDADAIIMNIAPVDYEYTASNSKIKSNELNLVLKKATDIIKDVKNIYKIGFALETENHLENAKEKLKNKNLDMIVVNDAKTMSSDNIHMGVLVTSEKILNIENQSKNEAAKIIIDELVNELRINE